MVFAITVALVASACFDSESDRAWCRQHEGELQQLGRGVGVDYGELNRAAYEHAPASGNPEQRETAYWEYLESNPTWIGLCREATMRRRGLDDWTAPPVPTRTPPGGGSQ